jgi:phosphoribosylamine---glycine ligase
LVVNGGRVLGITGVGASLSAAAAASLAGAAATQFDGCYFRRDIGWRALARGT